MVVPLKFVDPSGHEYQEGARYYYIEGYGLIDATHIGHGVRRINEIRAEVAKLSAAGGGKFTYADTAQESEYIGGIDISAEYSVQGNLTESEINQVSLSIAMNYEMYFEANQSLGSSFSMEDLPSDYLGYYIGLNPGATIEQALHTLGDDSAITSYIGPGGEGQAALIKMTSPLNYQFRPLPGSSLSISPPKHVDWPSPLQMPTSGSESGKWNALSIDVTPDTRSWYQKASDYGRTIWNHLK